MGAAGAGDFEWGTGDTFGGDFLDTGAATAFAAGLAAGLAVALPAVLAVADDLGAAARLATGAAGFLDFWAGM